jgi:ABC-type nitrate/sulfonate/bicarbonate transport system substrate-binding protein
MIGTGLVFAPSIVSAQNKLGPVKVFIGSNPSFGGIMIADQKKFFEQESLTVELTYFASGATAVDAFRAGRGDSRMASAFARLPITATSAWSLRKNRSRSRLI